MTDLKLMVVDHDHHTGEIRGVICRWCNAQIGKVENAANRAKRNLTISDWLDNVRVHRTMRHTGLMYPMHLTDAEKAAKAAAKRKAAAVARAAAKLKAK